MLGTERGCCVNALQVVVIEGWIFVFHKFLGEAPLAPSEGAVVQPRTRSDRAPFVVSYVAPPYLNSLPTLTVLLDEECPDLHAASLRLSWIKCPE